MKNIILHWTASSICLLTCLSDHTGLLFLGYFGGSEGVKMMTSRVWYIMPISEPLVSFLSSLCTPSTLFILRAVPLHSLSTGIFRWRLQQFYIFRIRFYVTFVHFLSRRGIFYKLHFTEESKSLSSSWSMKSCPMHLTTVKEKVRGKKMFKTSPESREG